MDITNITANEIREAFQAFREVGREVSSARKEAVLRAYQDNRALQTLLYYTLNNFKQYYIKQVPSVEFAEKDIDPENLTIFVELLEKLAAREIVHIKGFVAHFLSQCNMEEQLWYTRVLRRSLDIGISEKTVNKVWPGIIPVYEVQLADKVKDVTLTDAKTISRLPERFVIQYKIDGYRMNIHKKGNGKVDIRTRSGHVISGYDRLEEEAAKFLPNGYVYDGEMTSPELYTWIEQNMLQNTGDKIADRSLFTEAMSKAFRKSNGKTGIFNIFDMVPCSEWDSQLSERTYGDRNKDIVTHIQPVIERADVAMAVVPTSRVFYRNNPDDLAEVVKIFHKFLSWGWEGIMIKSIDAPYEWKRTKNQLKMKFMDTADLTVLGVEEAQGQGAGSIGKLVCDYKGTVLNIGTGRLTMKEKQDFWRDPNLIVGKTIEVSYQAESIGKNGEPVLDFAQYKSTRRDK